MIQPRIKRVHVLTLLTLCVVFLLAHTALRSFEARAPADGHQAPAYLRNIKTVNPDSPLDTRCLQFMDTLLYQNKTTEYSTFTFETRDFQLFLLNKINDTRKRKPPRERESWAPSQEDKLKWAREFDDNVAKDEEMRIAVREQTIDTRAFSHCYIKNMGSLEEKTVSRCADVERSLFPWLTHTLPQVNGHDTETLPEEECVLPKLMAKARKRGIVLSVANKHMNELVNLMISLRVLNNHLPIEIIFKGDFTEMRRNHLQLIANADFNDEENDTLLSVLQRHPDYSKISLSKSYPKLDITFIDIKDSITPKFSKKFKLYTNKLLACLFSTFEEMVLLDADVLPFIAPQDLFELPEYKSTGAFFFRDRELVDRSSVEDKQFWYDLLPTEIEQKVFGISNHVEKVANERYFKGFTHLMEAGLVVMNRQRFFSTFLHSIQLQLWSSATKRVWGDKEFFWLSMILDGEDSFEFNSNPVAAMGKLEPFPGEEDSAIKGICSTQPAHIYNDTLLWLNSGFQYCKYKTCATTDYSRQKQLTKEQLRTKYKGPIDVETAIIPPTLDDFYLQFTRKEEVTSQAWKQNDMCKAYMYCVKNEVEVEKKNMTPRMSSTVKYQGKLIDFTEQQRTDYAFVGNVWMNGLQLLKSFEKRANDKKKQKQIEEGNPDPEPEVVQKEEADYPQLVQVQHVQADG